MSSTVVSWGVWYTNRSFGGDFKPGLTIPPAAIGAVAAPLTIGALADLGPLELPWSSSCRPWPVCFPAELNPKASLPPALCLLCRPWNLNSSPLSFSVLFLLGDYDLLSSAFCNLSIVLSLALPALSAQLFCCWTLVTGSSLLLCVAIFLNHITKMWNLTTHFLIFGNKYCHHLFKML